jgi:hypothetical protein
LHHPRKHRRVTARSAPIVANDLVRGVNRQRQKSASTDPAVRIASSSALKLTDAAAQIFWADFLFFSTSSLVVCVPVARCCG